MANKKIKIDTDKLLDLLETGATHAEIAKYFNCGTRTIMSRVSELREDDTEVLSENVKLAKAKQRYQDINRIERKAFRLKAREDNAYIELHTEIRNLLAKHELPKKAFRTKKIKSSGEVGAVLHLTDLHLNELVNIISNKYDFTIASQRIRKFISDAKVYFKAKNVKDVCVCMTGDLINSDRRLDELLSQATNRAKALILSVVILEQAIMDLQQDFNVSVSSVIGNESRMTEDIGWTEDVTSDNYDFIIHNMLSLLFRNSDVKFFAECGTEQIIEIVGQNILMLHGNQIKGGKMEQSIQKILGKYSTEKINIDFVISGHLHSNRTSDSFSRGSSLVGSNAYSWGALQLAGRASQNIHIFYSNGNRDSIKIDLQETGNIEGYPIIKELEAYNAKSATKAKKKVIIQKLV